MIIKETFAEWKANGKGIDLNDSFDDGNHHVKHGGKGEKPLLLRILRGITLQNLLKLNTFKNLFKV